VRAISCFFRSYFAIYGYMKLCSYHGQARGILPFVLIKQDHIHLYRVIPPKQAVSKVVETIKKNTSRSLSRKFVFLKKVYWDRKNVWGKEYFVSMVGINEKVIRRYVQSPEEKETGQVKLEF